MTKNCPNCGAPIDIHRRSCEYCGTPYYANSQLWQAEQIRECMNAYPRAENDSSTADCVPGIWEDPVCPENNMLKDILLFLAMCAPFIVSIILVVFDII